MRSAPLAGLTTKTAARTSGVAILLFGVDQADPAPLASISRRLARTRTPTSWTKSVICSGVGSAFRETSHPALIFSSVSASDFSTAASGVLA